MNEKNQLSRKDIFKMFSFCHRLPERTFNFRGHYFPVCSRCTGIYLGAFTYFIYVFFFYVDYTYQLIFLAFLMILPTFVDGLSQFLGYRESNNVLRFSTGLLAGLGLAILVKALKWVLFGGNLGA